MFLPHVHAGIIIGSEDIKRTSPSFPAWITQYCLPLCNAQDLNWFGNRRPGLANFRSLGDMDSAEQISEWPIDYWTPTHLRTYG
jgi:hypothetical protein